MKEKLLNATTLKKRPEDFNADYVPVGQWIRFRGKEGARGRVFLRFLTVASGGKVLIATYYDDRDRKLESPQEYVYRLVNDPTEVELETYREPDSSVFEDEGEGPFGSH